MKLKSILLWALLFLGLNINNAQNPFTKLPYNILVGQTKSSEIENRGTCIKKIKVSDYVFRCEKYNIGDKFHVYCSQNKIVNKIVFSGLENHKLPSNWIDSGFELAKYTNSSNTSARLSKSGTFLSTFLKILSNLKIMYTCNSNDLEKIRDSTGLAMGVKVKTTVNFNVDLHSFEIQFIEKYWLKKEYSTMNRNEHNKMLSNFENLIKYCDSATGDGLYKIVVTEEY